jgi:uncharacterized caspase-like protein
VILSRAIAVLILSFCFSSAAFAEKRIALVIGNSEYNFAPLKNPKNDADDLTAALKRLHFDVVERKDLNIRLFDDTLDEFVERSKDADIAVFFFSGHGVQIDKRGYLAPIDIRAETESSALRELVAIQEVVSRIEHAAKVSMILLDACRDSPLQERLRRIAVEKNKALEPPKGLPPVQVVGSDTLIVYATVPGETASDGAGRNSPFTAALLKHIETPGVDVELMFKRVTADVLRATGGRQQPERLSRLQSELILLVDTAEQQLWDSVKDGASSEAIKRYLTKYPSGIFVPVARALIKQIEQQRMLDQAVKEEAKRRAEAERKEAEVRMLEENLKARETALAQEHRRIEEEKQREQAAKNGATARKTEEQRKQNEAKLAEERKAAEELKRNEELRQAKEEARMAAAAVQAAEKQRQEAEKAAAEARGKTESAATESRKLNESRREPAHGLSWAKGALSREKKKHNAYYGAIACGTGGKCGVGWSIKSKATAEGYAITYCLAKTTNCKLVSH